jgi:hypothetical protein
MPRNEEKIVHLEAALRNRFFPLVPKVEKPDRSGWNEERHDLDRLSRSLAAYTLVGECGIEDAVAAAAVTDGSDDFGIDALRFDRASNRLLVVQSKYKRAGTSPDENECLKTVNGVRLLLNRRFDGFNAAIRALLSDIEEALDTTGVSICILMVYLGDTFNRTAEHDLESFKSEINQFDDALSWQPRGLREVHDWLIEEQHVRAVNVPIYLENWAGSLAPRKVFYGQLKAADLAQLVEEHGTALFERNIRSYLGSNSVNTAIERTVSSRPGELFYLNNGITAIAEIVTKANGTPQRCRFDLQNVSIVNGAQTAGAITAAFLKGTISAEAKILITVIELGEENTALGMTITRARNYQTQVQGVNFAALDVNQERIRRELAAVGITYHYRPSEDSRTYRSDAFSLEEAALAIACFSFVPKASQLVAADPKLITALDLVVTAKRQIGRLWEPASNYYALLFPKNIASTRIWRLIQVYRFVDNILAESERTEEGFQRQMFFRHGRYFIMAFIALEHAAVLDRTELSLSANDQKMLSLQTDKLAEIIYAVADALFAYRGFQRVFRNLTDAQALVDGVLQQLALSA